MGREGSLTTTSAHSSMPSVADVDLLIDTSLAVPALVVGHEFHHVSAAFVRGRKVGLAGHALAETYAVITRLPRGLRVSPSAAWHLIDQEFPTRRHPSQSLDALVATLAETGIGGGATYDGLVGLVAVSHHLPLATRDRRALVTYRTVGAMVILVE